jgi:acyl-coenzyme A thioesterase PaaI-like protein
MYINLQIAVLGGLATIVILFVIGYFRLSSALGKLDQVLPVWESIAETPILGNFVGRIFTMLLKIRNPYSRSIGIYVLELRLIADFQINSLEVGRCRGQLGRSRTSDGPFRCTHGVALTLFAETLAGLAVFSRIGPKGKGILLKSETEYVKKAKGTNKCFDEITYS